MDAIETYCRSCLGQKETPSAYMVCREVELPEADPSTNYDSHCKDDHLPRHYLLLLEIEVNSIKMANLGGRTLLPIKNLHEKFVVVCVRQGFQVSVNSSEMLLKCMNLQRVVIQQGVLDRNSVSSSMRRGLESPSLPSLVRSPTHVIK